MNQRFMTNVHQLNEITSSVNEVKITAGHQSSLVVTWVTIRREISCHSGIILYRIGKTLMTSK